MSNLDNKIKLNIKIDSIDTIKIDHKNNKIIFFKGETVNLLLNIFDNNDEICNFTNTDEIIYTFDLYAKLSDGNSKLQNDNIVVDKNGLITIKLNNDLTNISGIAQYQLKISDNNKNENYLPIIIANIIDTLYFEENTETDVGNGGIIK